MKITELKTKLAQTSPGSPGHRVLHGVDISTLSQWHAIVLVDD